jgi:DNA-binding NtrC family response regulator
VKKRRVCFIDDEEEELSRTERALSQHFVIATGRDLDSALTRLERKPHLFLLDMYYGPKTKSEDRVRVATAWQQLRIAQSEFYALLTSLDQSSKGGLDLAEHVRARYPGTPVVFFTRKGSLEDANEALRNGATAVLKKPEPRGREHEIGIRRRALDDAMTAHTDELVRSLSHIIDRHSWWVRHARLRGFLEGVAASIVGSLAMLALRLLRVL